MIVGPPVGQSKAGTAVSEVAGILIVLGLLSLFFLFVMGRKPK